MNTPCVIDYEPGDNIVCLEDPDQTVGDEPATLIPAQGEIYTCAGLAEHTTVEACEKCGSRVWVFLREADPQDSYTACGFRKAPSVDLSAFFERKVTAPRELEPV